MTSLCRLIVYVYVMTTGLCLTAAGLFLMLGMFYALHFRALQISDVYAYYGGLFSAVIGLTFCWGITAEHQPIMAERDEETMVETTFLPIPDLAIPGMHQPIEGGVPAYL